MVSQYSQNNVFLVTGGSGDLKDEDNYPEGLNSIWVGGNKLSRGLTLPNLMVSYYLRPSRMYDTLMQMGRWFGYRKNYEDLCKVFTTGQLYNWFGHVSHASENLRGRIKNMKGLSPLEFQQQIQSHPGLMLVTARNKQQRAKRVKISYSGELVQITAFDLSKENEKSREANKLLIRNFCDLLAGAAERKDRNKNTFGYQGIPSAEITNFIKNFSHDEEAGTWDRKPIVKYIEEMAKHGELTEWTVVFVDSEAPDKHSETFEFADGSKINSVVRKCIKGLPRKDCVGMSNRSLVSVSHEKFDFEFADEMELIGGEKTRAGIRDKRDNKRGLLLVYFATLKVDEKALDSVVSLGISFPNSRNAKPVEFVVNNSFNVDDDFEHDD